jgi:replicative DNA helicase
VTTVDPRDDVAAQAERAVLGALLADSGAAWPDVAALIEPADFRHSAHAEIFETISGLVRVRSAADAVTVADAMEARGSLAAAGGLAALAKLSRDVPSVANAGAYAALVRSESLRHRARLMLLEAANELAERDQPPSDILGRLHESVTACIEAGAPRSDVSMLEASRLAVDDFDRRAALRQRGEIAGLCTGLARLDRLTGGLEPGLIVLAALTSLGKTALAWHIALELALAGRAGGMVSLEMSALELARRAFSRVHAIPLGDLLRGDAGAFHDLLGADQERRLAELPIRIDDSAGQLDQVVARVTAWHARYAITFAVVDYLQLIAVGDAETRQLEVARVSRELKRLSLRLRIPIIAISQFSRAAAAASSAGDRPELHHLRDSGSVEQDADQVWVLWRTSTQRDADAQDRPRQCNLSILKSRNGIVGDVYSARCAAGPLIFEASTQTFREYRNADGAIDGGIADDQAARRSNYAERFRR